jgi:SAM-dependent methyltransferase
MPRDVGALQAEKRRGQEAEESEADCCEKRLSQSDKIIVDPPSAFVAAWLPRLAGGTAEPPRALDLAMGRGRHTLALAQAGFRTFGVDADVEAIREALAAAERRRLVVRAWCADLRNYPLPRDAFDLVLVVRYLQRDLFGSIGDAVRAGGVLVYETFTVNQRALGWGPKSADHLLEPGELRRSSDGLDVMSYEETTESEAVARLVARKRSTGSMT